MATTTLTPEQIEKTCKVLSDPKLPMGIRFRALFTLKNLGGEKSIGAIGDCLEADDSALLKHECAYCLGQMQDSHAIPVLERVLSNTVEHPMVRHEAGEALGAIATDDCLVILKKYLSDPCKDVSETAILAVDRIEHLRKLANQASNGVDKSSIYSSVDPAPPLESDQPSTLPSVPELQAILTDPKRPLFERYRAMFSLRNINSDESSLALAEGLDCEDSALFRHEIAFVLGQMQRPVTVDKLAKCLARKDENEMVRHECAEALGAISDQKSNHILQEYLKDEARVVRESAIVALDISDYNNSEDFQFLDMNH